MTNILFIGGAGFIGSNIIHTLIKDTEYNIFVLEPVFANTNRLVDIEDDITIIRGALSDFDLLSSIIENHNISIIVHLVSMLIPGSTFEDFKREFEYVVFPTSRLMELCADKYIKFVYFSSGGTVYGNSTKGQKFKEIDNLAPISYYGLSKQIIENNILFENKRGHLNYLIIRPSNPFGKGQSLHGNQGFIAVAIGKILSGEPIEVWGDGSNVRDYLYIDDLADAFYKLIKKGINDEIINIGSGYGYSINDVIECLHNCIDVPFNVVYKESRNIDVNSMVLNISKLCSFIDVKHTHLKDGIQTFYKHVKQCINK